MKLTNTKALEIAISILESENTPYDQTIHQYPIEEIAAKLETIKGSMSKKATSKKATEKQEENEKYKELIVEYLKTLNPEEKVPCSQIAEAIPEFANMSNQKVTGLIRGLTESGIVGKEDCKGKKVYFLKTDEAEIETEEEDAE